ncbi:hypothetical protein ACFVUS_24140 [Nocardia sp. NPDC058058]|uniref:hypothetical protein n=1 Tax=Nocardia sp. NPDC058058 TaxID=3346317 RepID=UPI0036DD0CD4
MDSLQSSADNATHDACTAAKAHWHGGHPSPESMVHYSKGYPFWIALCGTIIYTLVPVTAIGILLLQRAVAPWWALIVYSLVAICFLMIWPIANEETLYYFQWPGGDYTSTMGNPCGFG